MYICTLNICKKYYLHAMFQRMFYNNIIIICCVHDTGGKGVVIGCIAWRHDDKYKMIYSNIFACVIISLYVYGENLSSIKIAVFF